MTRNMKGWLVFAAAGALFGAGAAFQPGTAEAHCGQHQGTCAEYQQYGYIGTHCEGDDLYEDYAFYDGYCNAPAPGCSGSGCLNWPCATGECRKDFGCYGGTYSTILEYGGC